VPALKVLRKPGFTPPSINLTSSTLLIAARSTIGFNRRYLLPPPLQFDQSGKTILAQSDSAVPFANARRRNVPRL
jgi:hypothetical protein